MPSPSAQPVWALTKSRSRSCWAPCQTRAQVRPPLLVARMVPVPTAKAVAVPPMAWTASSRSTWPSGRVVVGGAGAFVGGLGMGCGVVVGAGGADDIGVGAAAGWTVELAVQPVTATAAAKRTVVMIRTGRMATSPQAAGPLWVQEQHGGGRSRHSDGGASPQRRKGLDPVA